MSHQGASSRQQTAEEALHRVLGALREAEPSPRLEERTITAVQRRLATAMVPELSPSRYLFRSRFLVVAGMALAGALVVVPVLRRGSFNREAPRGTTSAEGVKQALPSETAGGRIVHEYHATKQRRPTQTQPTSSSLRPASGGKLPHPTMLMGMREAGTAWGSVSGSELAALEDAAPSQAEPFLPTTTEERQIRRFVERHKAYELAALDSRAEPAHERAETDEFQHFFAPPPELSGNLPWPTPDPKPATAVSSDPK